MNVGELRSLQLQRLKATLLRAYERVPFHRKAFDDAGVHPNELRSLGDLARFPFMTKAHFSQEYPFGLLAVPREALVRVHASSGTTGKPSIVGYTAKDIDTWAELMARSIATAGGKRGDLVHIAYGYGLFTGGLGAHYGAERLGCTVVPVSGGQTERQVQLIADLRPRILMCTPSYALVLAEEMTRQGMEPRRCSVEIGIFGAEPWTQELRVQIETRLGLNALDLYGLSEVMGPGVAQEHPEAKGALTVWEDHFYPEIVDPKTGAMLPDGESGELVITSLTKEALPVVRYRTRDLTRLLPGEGDAMRRIDRIAGRADDMMIIRGVNVFPSQIEELILRDDSLAPHYQIRLTRTGALDEATVLVEARKEMPAEARLAHAEELAVQIKRWVGVTVGVEMLEAGSIPRSAGKAPRILDERPR